MHNNDMNFSHNNEKYNDDNIEYVDYFAILTGRKVPQVYTLDTALATFQYHHNNNLKFSVKIIEMKGMTKQNNAYNYCNICSRGSNY